MERINQLNVLRESNATLRSECEAHRRRSETLDEKLGKLAAEVEPVKEETHTLRAELELRGQQLQQLERENQQWKDRSQQILSKVCMPKPSFKCYAGSSVVVVRSHRSCRDAAAQRKARKARDREG